MQELKKRFVRQSNIGRTKIYLFFFYHCCKSCWTFVETTTSSRETRENCKTSERLCRWNYFTNISWDWGYKDNHLQQIRDVQRVGLTWHSGEKYIWTWWKRNILFIPQSKRTILTWDSVDGVTSYPTNLL